MKKNVLIGLGGFLAGLLLMGVIVFKSAPGLMMMEDESKYAFDKTVERLEAEVKAANWKVVGIHDMQNVLAGMGYDVKAVKIYELCSSKYSAKILEQDDERIVSPLMPCRVAIYEKSDGKTYIARMNSKLMAKTFGGLINEVMRDASDETEVIIANLIR